MSVKGLVVAPLLPYSLFVRDNSINPNATTVQSNHLRTSMLPLPGTTIQPPCSTHGEEPAIFFSRRKLTHNNSWTVSVEERDKTKTSTRYFIETFDHYNLVAVSL